MKPQFDSYAKEYDALHRRSITASGEEPAYFAEYKIKYIAQFLGNSVTQGELAVMDFGCGIGNCIPHINRHLPNARVHGVDISSESLALAKERFPAAAFTLLKDGKIPLSDQSVDVAFAACVFHHIAPAERQSWSKEVQRVLKPGGSFFIFEHNPLNPVTQLAVKGCEFDHDAVLLSRQECVELLSSAGLHGASAHYIVFFPRVLAALRAMERHLGWLPLGAQYVAHGRA